MNAIRFEVAVGVGLAIAALGAGAAPRAFVSTAGNDVNPCTVGSPCRTLQAAINAVDAGGEVVALESGGYGTMIITRSVAVIVPPGVHAAITANGVDGVYVNAPGISVVLRGLYLNGTGTDGSGIHFKQGATLHVENCVINGFTGFAYFGIYQEATGNMFVKDTIVRNNFNGIGVGPQAQTPATASLDRVRVENSSMGGIQASGPVQVTVRDSVSAHNTSFNFGAFPQNVAGIHTYLTIENSAAIGSEFGIAAQASGVTGGTAYVSVANSVVAHNTWGIRANTNGVIVVAGSTVKQNVTGLSYNSAGILRSYGNNRVFGNTTDGAPTSTLAPL
jgi:hypothetical protein